MPALLGLLYLYLMRYKSWLHNGLLLASVLPIAFGVADLYEWARPEHVAHDPILQHKSLYLNVPFFLARTVGEFRLVGVFKRVRGTPFATWDTWLFTPLCGLIAAGFFLIAS